MASSPRVLMKYVRNTLSPSRMNALWPCHSSTPKSLSKESVIVYHGISQPMRAFRRSMSACGARDAYTRVVSRAFKWARWETWSAPQEPLARGFPFLWRHYRRRVRGEFAVSLLVLLHLSLLLCACRREITVACDG